MSRTVSIAGPVEPFCLAFKTIKMVSPSGQGWAGWRAAPALADSLAQAAHQGTSHHVHRVLLGSSDHSGTWEALKLRAVGRPWTVKQPSQPTSRALRSLLLRYSKAKLAPTFSLGQVTFWSLFTPTKLLEPSYPQICKTKCRRSL